MVDPRPYTVGKLTETFEKYTEIGVLLPAMGYSDQQVKDLETTINNCDCEGVVIGTPIDLRRIVTINKPYFSIVKNLNENGVETEGLYFIDASSQEGDATKGENYERIKSAGDLTEIMLSVGKVLKKGEYYALIFDSLSTLLAYHGEEMVIRFSHSLVNKLRKHGVKGIFLCTKEDMNTSLMKNLNMLADYSVDIEKKGDISADK